MTPEELKFLIRDVNADIARMTRASQTQSEVRNEIRRRAQNPKEEQLIDADTSGIPLGEPRVIRTGDVELKIWKIHRAGLNATDIKGADLYYEIANHKFILVQYKTPSASGRVTKDSEQINALKAACPNQCSPSNRFSCGSWFALRDGDDGVYYPACEAERIFGTFASRGKSSFINGLSKMQFQAEFGQCRIGGRTTPINVTDYRNESVASDRLYFHVVQRPISK